jgi:hypothetical protein
LNKSAGDPLTIASVLAAPSIAPEAFGRAAVEAQAMVVVSNRGALPETVLAPPQTPAGARTGWRISPAIGRRSPPR